MNLNNNKFIYHYKLIKKIASGGMGEVYLAEDTKLKRQVALKILSPALSKNNQFREMFTSEAQVAAGIEHPNIVTIHEIIEYENRPIIVMEYVEGETLQSIAEKEKLPVKKIIEILLQICSALHEAHKAGIIHRDIKSSNLILDSKGQIRILDFGLAGFSRQLEYDYFSKSSGTLGFMSPEQVQGNNVTTKSDLFSLGVVFYHMLSGKMPFPGDYEAAIKYAIVSEKPASIKDINSDVDEDLENIVFKLLEKDPQTRYQSSLEILEDLENYSSRKEKAPSPNDRSAMRQKRNLVFGFAAALIVIIVYLIFITDLSDYSKQEKIMLAVLPFENLGAVEDEYFSDGMTDAITLNLAKINGIGVISRRSAMLYKGSDLNLVEIGDELDVTYLLTGTVHWDKTSGNKVRIYTALVDAVNDTYLWTNHYDSRLEKIFELQTSISHEITQALHLVLTEGDRLALKEVPTTNIKAYDFYLQGNKYFNRSWDMNDISIAIQMYQQAIALDPAFAAAHAMLSRGYASMYWEYYNHSSEMCDDARQSAEQALALQANQPEGFLALGYYYYHCELNFQKALTVFQDGLALHPNNGDLYNAVAAVLRRQGKLRESCDNFIHALKLDPRSHLKAFDIALTYGIMRMYDSSKYYVDKSISLNPDYSLAYIYSAWQPIIRDGNIDEAVDLLSDALQKTDLTSSKYYWWLLRILQIETRPTFSQITPGTDSVAYYLYLSQKNRLAHDYINEKTYADSALKILEEKIQKNPDVARFNSALGLAYAGKRNREKAFFYGEKALELAIASKEGFDAPFLVLDYAEILMIFEENDAAVEQLKYLMTIPGLVSRAYLKTDPLWQPLHNEQAFKDLLEEVK